MLGTSLLPVVCSKAHVLFVLFALSGSTCALWCPMRPHCTQHGRYLIRGRHYIHIAITWNHPRVLMGSAYLFRYMCSLCVLCVIFVVVVLICFVLCLVYSMLPVSLDCPVLIGLSVFSNVGIQIMSLSKTMITEWIMPTATNIYRHRYRPCDNTSCGNNQTCMYGVVS